jgi:metallo-beta-lactamase class B
MFFKGYYAHVGWCILFGNNAVLQLKFMSICTIFGNMKPFIFLLLFIYSVAAFGQNKVLKIKTTHLTGDIYVCTSYGILGDGSVFPANDMYIVTKNGIILVDTPWGEAETCQLMDTLWSRYHKKILLCISTHFHEDRVGGVDVLKKKGIKTYSSLLTQQLAKQRGEKQPEYAFTNDTTFNVDNVILRAYYPGAGHTKDNIVIWLPQSKVLFGGCLIKSLDATDIGNLADANLSAWPSSIANVKANFKGIKYVIPGHQGWQGDTSMFGHTVKLASQTKH